MPLQELRTTARAIFDASLRAVDAREAVRVALSRDGSLLKICDRDFDLSSKAVYVIAIGKAAPSMASGLVDILGNQIREGLITGPKLLEPQLFSPDIWRIFAGGHPLPNEQSIQAAKAAFSLLSRANNPKALIIFLISGGGSAMIEWPRSEEITLEDLQQANRRLVASGATIKEINAVRRTFSTIKGGGLKALAPLASQINLIVSDVNRGDEKPVASGPSIAAQFEDIDPMQVVMRYGLQSTLPPSIVKTVRERHVSFLDLEQIGQSTYVLLDNEAALTAAAETATQIGFEVEIASEINEQPIEAGCRLLLSRLDEARSTSGTAVCLISGGEFSCPVKGNGHGGRNLETALRCALMLDQEAPTWHTVVLSAGTDGIDGNSPAAGAIADETTIAVARSKSLRAQTYLENSDSFSFFNSLGDTIVTGPTGTNVRDVRIVLSQSY